MNEPRSDRDDLDAAKLDDVRDREELRHRYDEMLQELRVLLPGVQVLVAFLLTIPFANRFLDLDEIGRLSFGVAMFTGMVSVVCLLTPTAFHRMAPRTARSARLAWAIRMLKTGVAAMAVALVAALFAVSRFVFGTSTGSAMAATFAVLIVLLWVVLPRVIGERAR